MPNSHYFVGAFESGCGGKMQRSQKKVKAARWRWLGVGPISRSRQVKFDGVSGLVGLGWPGID